MSYHIFVQLPAGWRCAACGWIWFAKLGEPAECCIAEGCGSIYVEKTYPEYWHWADVE